MSTPGTIDSSSPEALLAYYRRLFPFKALFTWLNQSPVPSKLFTNREFAFTLEGDVYLRYNSFTTADELKKQICEYKATRFEIGPVYNARPRDKRTVKSATFAPQQRELVFDIDMTDYDGVRTCCSNADICARCWGFIAAAVHVLDGALREQFGYKHLLWVYSGRRGIHCWVSDAEALALTDEQRRAVVGWLGVVQGGKDQHKKVNVRLGSRKLPPSLETARDLLVPAFSDLILADQDCFASEEGWEALLHLLPAGNGVESLRRKWTLSPGRDSAEKWMDVKDEVRKLEKGSAPRATWTAALEDVVLQYMYPRLDAEVSKHRNHLLKAPFCIHPKTGRVCVPVDPAHVDAFDPATVPTLGQLLQEVDAAGASAGAETGMEGGEGESRTPDWERTSLKPYVEMLEKHAAAVAGEARQVKRERGDLTW